MQGSYPAGKYTHINFSIKSSPTSLSRASASRPLHYGYADHADKTKWPKKGANPWAKLVMQRRVEARQKTFN